MAPRQGLEVIDEGVIHPGGAERAENRNGLSGDLLADDDAETCSNLADQPHERPARLPRPCRARGDSGWLPKRFGRGARERRNTRLRHNRRRWCGRRARRPACRPAPPPAGRDPRLPGVRHRRSSATSRSSKSAIRAAGGRGRRPRRRRRSQRPAPCGAAAMPAADHARGCAALPPAPPAGRTSRRATRHHAPARARSCRRARSVVRGCWSAGRRGSYAREDARPRREPPRLPRDIGRFRASDSIGMGGARSTGVMWSGAASPQETWITDPIVRRSRADPEVRAPRSPRLRRRAWPLAAFALLVRCVLSSARASRLFP